MPTQQYSKPDKKTARPVQAIDLAGHKGIIGFEWQTLNTPLTKQQLKNKAKSIGANVWSLHTSQLGLGFTPRKISGRSLVSLVQTYLHGQSAQDLFEARNTHPKISKDILENEPVNDTIDAEKGNAKTIPKDELNQTFNAGCLLGIFPLQIADKTFFWLYAEHENLLVPGYADAIFESLDDCRDACLELASLYQDNLCSLKILNGKLTFWTLNLEQQATQEENSRLKSENSKNLAHPFKDGTFKSYLKPLAAPDETAAWLAQVFNLNLRQRLSLAAGVYDSQDLTLPKVRQAKRGIIFLLLLFLLAWLAQITNNILTDLGLTTLALEKQEAQIKERNFLLHNPEKIFPLGWRYGQFDRDIFQTSCATLLASKHYYLGWKLTRASLNFDQDGPKRNMTLNLVYEHTRQSNFTDLPAQANISATGKAFNWQESLGAKSMSDLKIGYRDLPSQEELKRIFFDLAQNFQIKTSLNLQKEVQKKHRVGVFNCPWVVGTFTLSGIRLSQMEALGDHLAQIKGCKLVEISLERGRFGLTGEVYAQGLKAKTP